MKFIRLQWHYRVRALYHLCRTEAPLLLSDKIAESNEDTTSGLRIEKALRTLHHSTSNQRRTYDIDP